MDVEVKSEKRPSLGEKKKKPPTSVRALARRGRKGPRERVTYHGEKEAARRKEGSGVRKSQKGVEKRDFATERGREKRRKKKAGKVFSNHDLGRTPDRKKFTSMEKGTFGNIASIKDRKSARSLTIDARG